MASQCDPVWRRAARVPFDCNAATQRPPVGLPADFAERPLFDLLCAAAARDPDALAVVDGSEHLTYRDLLDRIGRAARRIAAEPPGAVAVFPCSALPPIAGLSPAILLISPTRHIDEAGLAHASRTWSGVGERLFTSVSRK